LPPVKLCGRLPITYLRSTAPLLKTNNPITALQ